jgi:hypothetical protein
MPMAQQQNPVCVHGTLKPMWCMPTVPCIQQQHLAPCRRRPRDPWDTAKRANRRQGARQQAGRGMGLTATAWAAPWALLWASLISPARIAGSRAVIVAWANEAASFPTSAACGGWGSSEPPLLAPAWRMRAGIEADAAAMGGVDVARAAEPSCGDSGAVRCQALLVRLSRKGWAGGCLRPVGLGPRPAAEAGRCTWRPRCCGAHGYMRGRCAGGKGREQAWR